MENKNILLSTIYRADNYGAVFQAYSLSCFLKNNNKNNVFILNDSPQKISQQFTALRTYSYKSLLKDSFRFFPRARMIRKFKDFINQNFNEITLDKISSIKFDLCVTGSDQVWNPNIISDKGELLSNYFFEGINTTKIAFSASLGSYRYNPNQLARFKELTKSYSCITIREQDTAIYLQSEIKRDVHNTLDPTLIQHDDFWYQMTDNVFKSEDFILVYYNNSTVELTNAVNYIKRKLNLPVIVINNWYNKKIDSNEYIKDAGPIEFLSAFKSAKYIITNTFHGVCFSINFKKDFLYIDNGIHSNRMTSLLSKIDGLHKIIILNDEKQTYIDKLKSPISYKNLSDEKKSSIKLLLEYL